MTKICSLQKGTLPKILTHMTHIAFGLHILVHPRSMTFISRLCSFSPSGVAKLRKDTWLTFQNGKPARPSIPVKISLKMFY